MVGLGGLPGGEVYSVANGVSADGQIVVGLTRVSPLPDSGHAFRWTAETGMVHLERPANATGAGANAVSADGSIIVGTMALDPPPGQTGDREGVAFRWTPTDGMVSLGDLSGGRVRSTALDVSADGSVIVGVGETFSEPGVGATQEAFYWSSHFGMVNLRDLLIAGGATGLDDWLLTEANGVSYDGQTIVGTGIHNGVTEAWVATIPEPSTIVLAVLPAFVLFAIRLRQKFAAAADNRR
jgi:uncharacterized membrane protein